MAESERQEGIWMMNLSSRAAQAISPKRTLYITNAALPRICANSDDATYLDLKWQSEDEKEMMSAVVAVLKKGGSEHARLFLKLDPPYNYVLNANGPNGIDLIGHYEPHEEAPIPNDKIVKALIEKPLTRSDSLRSSADSDAGSTGSKRARGAAKAKARK